MQYLQSSKAVGVLLLQSTVSTCHKPSAYMYRLKAGCKDG